MADHPLTRAAPRLGILGGGQLAKMLAQAAAQLGVRTAILHNGPASSAIAPGPVHTGNWNDPDTLCAFAKGCDVVTLENEFIEADALAEMERAGHRLYPTAACLALVQDKWIQKQTLATAGLPVAPCRSVDSPEEIIEAARAWGWPLVLKRRHLGYDGKGNATVRAPSDVTAAWNKLGGDSNALYVERFCAFDRELAIMVTRTETETAVYPVVDTVQRDHICHTVTAPSALSPEQAAAAAHIARRAVGVIGGVGSMGIELFLMPDGELLINEMAPRVHNSGHYTIEACHCSQFENHIRAVLGWPLGSPALRSPAAAMVNLIGAADGPAHPTGLDAALRVVGAHVHLYGKDRSARGRKMGHVTALGATRDEALSRAMEAATHLRFG